MTPTQKTPPYPFFFDHKPGFVLSWFFYRLFRRVQFDQNMTEELRQMQREGTVVYAIKYRGVLDFLLYHYRFRRGRLPYPKIAFDLNLSMVLPLSQLIRVMKYEISKVFGYGYDENAFVKEAIKQGTTSLLCLVNPREFVRRFIHAQKGHLHFLLETQREMDRPIFIVPQLILYEKSPEREPSLLRDILFGFKDNPGYVRKIALFFRHNRRAFIDFGKPLNLQAYLGSQSESRSTAEMASEIQQMLIESIDTQKRVVLGPIMKSRLQFKERVLMSQEIAGTIEKMAGREKRQSKRLKRKAGDYFDEIAADYNFHYIQLFQVALTWFWKKLFEGIDVKSEEFAVLREWARKGPIIYVPSHKSHIDYLVINYVLYQHHMHIPRVAAGKNLAFWPMGHIFRKSGAFFIRRSFKGAKLYAKVFSGYVKALLEEGHPLEFFIEGGRSRSGKLILPKIGFLSILIEAFKEGYCKDLVFVSASISYDRILEEKSYLREIGGEAKEKESFMQVLKARHFLKRRYGKIYLRFGQPLSFREYIGREGEARGEVHRHLAFHLIQSINAVTLVTPLSLVASAILTKHRRGFYFSEFMNSVSALLGHVHRLGIPTASTLESPEKAIRETLSLLISWKVLNSLEEITGEEKFYYVEEEKKRELEYYKNGIIHFFISHAFVALSLLSGSEEAKTEESVLEDYTFMSDLLQKEFVYDRQKEKREIVDQATAYFMDAGFITRNGPGKGFTLTKLGFDRLPLWAGLAKTFLESYWVASKALLKGETGNQKRNELLKSMTLIGVRFQKLGLIDHGEAVSQITFKNALQFFSERTASGAWKRERLLQVSQRLQTLSHYKS
jgi:glycerol-3-phosphate O-acyltransferase